MEVSVRFPVIQLLGSLEAECENEPGIEAQFPVIQLLGSLEVDNDSVTVTNDQGFQ